MEDEFPEFGFEPEAYDALSELAVEWGISVSEVYLSMLWIAQGPENTKRAIAKCVGVGEVSVN